MDKHMESKLQSTKDFKFVSYLWDRDDQKSDSQSEVDLLLYRSNLLGSDLRLTNFGGGNTSCKVVEVSPLSKDRVDVMYVKGSGGDLKTLNKKGLSSLYLHRLVGLENVYRGLEYEDEMVELYNHCLFDLNSKAPSIDTPLHAFLPFKHIDHLHPDAAIAIAASKDGKKITEELFDGTLGWVDWQRPGFDLGLKLKQCYEDNPSIRGIMLGSHGLFTWGDTSYDCYINTLQVIEKCAEYLENKYANRTSFFGGEKLKSASYEARRSQASKVMPILRGLCSTNVRMIGHFNDTSPVLEYVNSVDLTKLAPLGTSCPDHFLRTKIQPLVIDLRPDEDFTHTDEIKAKLNRQIEEYRAMYTSYYQDHKFPDSPPMRDPNPVVFLYPGVGMFTFAKDKATARIASEFYVNAINVMKGAEAISSYTSLPRQEAFNIEYWALEEAKLMRQPKPKALSGKIALITGSAGGIGKAIAKKFIEEGACIVLNDSNSERLQATAKEFQKAYSTDQFTSIELNVLSNEDVGLAFDHSSLTFGGVDIVVNCAGLSISKPLEDHTEQDWDLVYDVLAKGQFLVTKRAVNLLRMQDLGGDILNIVSKNALVSGPNNAAYGSAKAAQLHLSRLNAAELGKDKIRVNVVNPDAVIFESQIWEGDWAEGRAKAYGVKVEDLPEFYAKRTLLQEVILPEDIANACFAFTCGMLNKSTGNVLNIDGGVPGAFVR